MRFAAILVAALLGPGAATYGATWPSHQGSANVNTVLAADAGPGAILNKDVLWGAPSPSACAATNAKMQQVREPIVRASIPKGEPRPDTQPSPPTIRGLPAGMSDRRPATTLRPGVLVGVAGFVLASIHVGAAASRLLRNTAELQRTVQQLSQVLVLTAA